MPGNDKISTATCLVWALCLVVIIISGLLAAFTLEGVRPGGSCCVILGLAPAGCIPFGRRLAWLLQTIVALCPIAGNDKISTATCLAWASCLVVIITGDLFTLKEFDYT